MAKYFQEAPGCLFWMRASTTKPAAEGTNPGLLGMLQVHQSLSIPTQAGSPCEVARCSVSVQHCGSDLGASVCKASLQYEGKDALPLQSGGGARRAAAWAPHTTQLSKTAPPAASVPQVWVPDS